MGTPTWHWAAVGKAAAAVVLLSGLCVAAYALGYRNSTKANPSIVVPSVSAEVIEPASIPDDLSQQGQPAPAQAESSRTSAPLLQRAVRPKMVPTAKPLSDSDAYLLELRILRPAQQAIGRQSFADALVHLMEHQRRFPAGQLTEEREALRVKALVGLDRLDEARRVATSFGERFPHSALLGTIKAQLGAHR
jgi:hypothetical protein